MEQMEASRRIQLTWLEEAFLPESFVRSEYQHSELRGGHSELSLHLAEFIKCPWGAAAEKELGCGAISVPVSQTARDCRARKVSAIISLFVQKLYSKEISPPSPVEFPTLVSPADLLEDVVSADAFDVFLYYRVNAILLCQLFF